MAQCIGNCIKCTLVTDDEKVTCCTFQTLKQCIEIRGQLKALKEMVEALPASVALSSMIEEIDNADPPAAQDNQEPQIKKAKK